MKNNTSPIKEMFEVSPTKNKEEYFNAVTSMTEAIPKRRRSPIFALVYVPIIAVCSILIVIIFWTPKDNTYSEAFDISEFGERVKLEGIQLSCEHDGKYSKFIPRNIDVKIGKFAHPSGDPKKYIEISDNRTFQIYGRGRENHPMKDTCGVIPVEFTGTVEDLGFVIAEDGLSDGNVIARYIISVVDENTIMLLVTDGRNDTFYLDTNLDTNLNILIYEIDTTEKIFYTFTG
ncbi:MAG: hypothetical protein FWF82_02180 [Oscillospiraceae bacterium]|nr:hypothetical protein [Oscillospiraceae bacterium]